MMKSMVMKKAMMLGLAVVFLSMTTLAFAEEVFVTKQGKKYHKEVCRLTKNRDVSALDKETAETKGYTPCSRCFSDASQGESSLKNSSVAKISKAKKSTKKKEE